jgi:hypothetical protein
MTSYSATISMETPIATAVLRIHAYDIDKDTFYIIIDQEIVKVVVVVIRKYSD